MTTREKVAAECIVLLNTDPDVSDVYAEEAADRIAAIFAEERAALMAAMRDATGMDDDEIADAGLAHLIEELARARDEQAEKVEQAEAREATKARGMEWMDKCVAAENERDDLLAYYEIQNDRSAAALPRPPHPLYAIIARIEARRIK